MPIWGEGLNPAPPEGYDYDYLNADALLNRMSVEQNGKLTLPDGMSYRLLVLPNTDQMTLPVLKKIHELVGGGAIVAGRKPLRTPGLTSYPESDKLFHELVFDLWGDLDGISRTQRSFGKGKIIWGLSLSRTLSLANVSRDIEYNLPSDGMLSWIHRRTNDTDIYFIVNRTDTLLNTDLRLRVNGKVAEIWDPGDGSIEKCNYRFENNKTVVQLQLSERQSLFLVFRNKATSSSKSVIHKSFEILDTLDGAWEITFPAGLGAPERTTINHLESWTQNSDEGIKYFSGTATYTKRFTASKKWLQPGKVMILDLGKVGDIAEVRLNGTPLGIFWKPPYEAEITSILKKGENYLEIKVTNQWTNRLSGDQKAAAGKKVLNSPLFVFPGRKLNDSGLLGPVIIVRR